jgi:hypothetical protein
MEGDFLLVYGKRALAWCSRVPQYSVRALLANRLAVERVPDTEILALRVEAEVTG